MQCEAIHLVADSNERNEQNNMLYTTRLRRHIYNLPFLIQDALTCKDIYEQKGVSCTSPFRVPKHVGTVMGYFQSFPLTEDAFLDRVIGVEEFREA